MRYSIITPVYNREDCIGRCIGSVICNLASGIDIQHIIIDDGSTDKTPNIIENFSVKYAHIKFIRLPRNRGTNAARNVAIKEADGDFCIILDSDDYWVENAIVYIDNVVRNNLRYREFMFSCDDMVTKYNNNKLLCEKTQTEITFRDMLAGKVSGDFVHVIETNIMKSYPFDEQLRIYEGVFFLRFYKESERILFTNKIISVRERSRADSVTRESFRTNETAIYRAINASKLQLDWFEEDYVRLKLIPQMSSLLMRLIDNSLLALNYSDAKTYIHRLAELGVRPPLFLYWVYYLRLGMLYRLLLKCYLIVKYKLINRKLK